MALCTCVCARGQAVIDRPTAWRFARECASGIGHIHSMGYMHRDIKSLNVFVTADLVCKVADFGMCTNEATSCEVCGTPQWMAPEVAKHLVLPIGSPPYDRHCDIYSYAILLWEIFHSSVPYMETRLDQTTIAQMVADTRHNFRPKINPGVCPEQIQAILLHCWHNDPTARPSFPKIVQQLDAVREAVVTATITPPPPPPPTASMMR